MVFKPTISRVRGRDAAQCHEDKGNKENIRVFLYFQIFCQIMAEFCQQ